MGFMGGQPATAYEARGFTVCNSWIDQQLAETVVERNVVAPDAELDAVARVGLCVRTFGSG